MLIVLKDFSQLNYLLCSGIKDTKNLRLGSNGIEIQHTCILQIVTVLAPFDYNLAIQLVFGFCFDISRLSNNENYSV